MRPWVRAVLILLAILSAPSVFADQTRILLQTPLDQVYLDVEIADDPIERAEGLMGREDIKPGQGMLFVFDDEYPRSFWMKNTPLSLDILFFDAEGRWVSSQLSTTPFSTKTLPSGLPAQYALEILAGESERLGLGQDTILIWP
jgi:uncharacterized membrane protein (UPF0127 family)